MKKKILVCLFVSVMCFNLTGCGKEEALNNEDIKKQVDSNTESEEDYNIKLYSDDTKMVFNFSGIYYVTYYYSGDKITGLEYVYDCGDKSTAKLTEASIKANYETVDNVKSVDRKGKYVIITWTEEEYKDDTVEEIKETYSYLEEVQKES